MIVIAPTLDSLINESEHEHIVSSNTCEFKLGRGKPLSKMRCSICLKLSGLIDLHSSWTQRINSGRLTGCDIEIVQIVGVKSIKEAAASWKIYRESQRIAQHCLLRRYYMSFSCSGNHFALREVCSNGSSPPPSLPEMIAQLIELFDSEGLPVHGNPTRTTIAFHTRLPVPLRHSVRGIEYSSSHLIQIDSLNQHLRMSSGGSLIDDEQPLGAIRCDEINNTITIRRESSFTSFLREYPRYANAIALQFFLRSLFSFYPLSETKVFSCIGVVSSTATTLSEAFQEIKGTPFPRDIFPIIKDTLVRLLPTVTLPSDSCDDDKSHSKAS